MNKPVFMLDQVCFGFEKRDLFSNVTLSIPEKSWVGIIGSNGSGKTTLLQLLLGIYQPRSGSVVCTEDTKKIGYVPQLEPINLELPISALDVVLMGQQSALSWWGRYPKKQIEKAKSLLRELGLHDVDDQFFYHLSGGQKKRVLMARALLCDPAVLILDEPTSGVDIESQQLIYQFLEKSDATIIQVTHEIDTIVNKVDFVLSMSDGVELKKPSEICEHFAKGLYHTPLVESTCA